MTFLHPWMIGAGAAAVSLPVLIHWLTRPRPVRLPLSTIRFVFQAARQRRARHRLRDAILLLLRVAAVLLVAMALARPLLGAKAARPVQSSGGTRVVLLDCSQSMAAASGGMKAFDRARSVAGRHLAYDVGLRCNLLLGAAKPRGAFDRPSTNFTALREELSAADVRPERLDVAASIRAAAEVFAQSPPGTRELVVVSDFQRSNWAAVDFSPLPKDVAIKLESVAPAAIPANLAILRVAVAGRVERSREARLEVEVANFSPAARPVPVEVTVGDKSYRLDGNCPSRSRTTLTTGIVLGLSGWQGGEAKLVGVEDALAADNVRPFALDVRPAPTFALVTRQSAGPQASSSNYLEFALTPTHGRGAEAAAGGERVVRVDPAALDREVLAPAELIVIDHPGKLSAEWVRWLAGALRRGRPILYFASEPTDATNLKLLADAAGSDLKMPVEFVPPAAGQTRRDLFLQEVNAKVLPFSVFGDGLAAVTGSLRFNGGLSSRRLDGGLADDILAAYGDRSAALVVTPCGAGTLGVFNLDLGTSNLASSPAFVPLLAELVDRLVGEKRRELPAPCGEPLAVYLPPEAGGAAGLTVLGPGGAAVDAGVFSDDASGTLWRWTPATPGAYQVQRDGKTVFALAATIPPDEADLTPIDPALFMGRLAGGREIEYRSPSLEPEKKDDAWAWLAVGCMGCLLAEAVALKLFRL